MHLLRSTALGTEVIDDTDHQIQGKVADILIDPDRGKVVAVFVSGHLFAELQILQIQDVASWGNRIHVRSADVIGPSPEVIRLQPLIHDRRTTIGQRIRTENGVVLGKCSDVQFRTDTFGIEWIFPRKLFRKGLALPASDILEITEEAIVVRDQGPKGEEVVARDGAARGSLDPIISPATGRTSSRYTGSSAPPVHHHRH